ncbi:DUF2637 domain-containing protein [Streptomyces sp. NPDC094471]|uniref:DUF2637 domain-containing protein n=1 Tax=Streptomyces sp. NPDC094471 TaxID=3155209 RepID=UPI003332A4AC
MSEKELRTAERTLSHGTWAITFGAVLFSVLTVTPLVQVVTPDRWDWTAPILPLVVDAAVIIVVRLDGTISRLGGSGGFWPALLRWMTGAMTWALNVGNSALHGDRVGVAVHSVAPLLLIVTAEAALAYRRAITRALDGITAAAEKAAAKEQADAKAAADQARQEQEAARARAEEREEKERARAEKAELDRIEREERHLAEQREHERQMAQDQADREERARREEREDRWRREQAAAREADRVRQARADQLRAQQTAAAAVPVPAQAATQSSRRQVVVREVGREEWPDLPADQKEERLYELYRQARDESEYADHADDPRFRQGGDLNGSQLGVRLGRSAAAGRTNVKPKFELRYTAELAARQAKELVAAG